MELTDKNEILRQMQNSRTDCPYEGQQAGAWKVAHDCCSSIVESVAAIEAEPVRHGRWICQSTSKSYSDYRCSECDAAVITNSVYTIDNFHYCHSCGSKMNGKSVRVATVPTALRKYGRTEMINEHVQRIAHEKEDKDNE